MKNKSHLFIITTLLITVSCRKALKDVNDYYPKVKTVSAVVQSDGSVRVSGEIESAGYAPVEYAGACFDYAGNPMMDKNQLIAVTESNFSVVYPASTFTTDSTYYFCTWAANDYGYSMGQVISVNNIIASPVTPPCSLVMNTVNIGGAQPTHSYNNVSNPTVSMGQYSFTASTGTGPIVNFTFGSVITTGIFTTTTNTSPSAGQVYINFYDGMISGSLGTGSNVYVNTVSPGVFDVSICNAPWVYSSSTLYFNTRLTVPY